MMMTTKKKKKRRRRRKRRKKRMKNKWNEEACNSMTKSNHQKLKEQNHINCNVGLIRERRIKTYSNTDSGLREPIA
jgi:hypothetical protein